MYLNRCPACNIPVTEDEYKLGKCQICEQPFPEPVVDTPSNKAQVIAQRPRSNSDWTTRGLICVGFLLLACLIWFGTSTKDTQPVAELGRIDERLQKLEQFVESKTSNQPDEAKALQTRLNQLDAKLTKLLTPATPTQAENQTQQLARLEALLDGLAQRAFAPPAPPGPLQIRVTPKDWGDADPENMQAVCISAASEIWKNFPDRRVEPISVTYSTKGPMVVFGRGPDGERRVLLDVQGKLWARYAYQFAHEFCHILCNYREVKHPNHWFEETLCETASLYSVRRMAESWKAKPPYPNWKDYSDSLADYFHIMEREVPALDKVTLAEWFAINEKQLRTDGTDRPRNRLVALSILPMLEKNPHHWQAVSYLNHWDPKDANMSFAAYLSDWHQRVPKVHKAFVQDIATMLAINLK